MTPGAENPESHSSPPETEPSDLTISRLESSPEGPDTGEQADTGKPEPDKTVQSIFSARSGIQDLLRKPEPAPSDVTPDGKPGPPEKALEKTARKTAPVTPLLKPPVEQPEERQPEKPALRKSRRNLDRVRRRQMSYLQKRREQKKMRVFYSRIRFCFKLCFAILWGILLWELLHSPLWVFRAPQYSVRNEKLVQAGQLAPLVQAWVGKPLFEVDSGKLAGQIEERFKIADKVTVRRQLFPARLDIAIHEKTPWAEIYADERAKQPYALLMPDTIISLADYQYRPEVYAPQRMERIILPPKTSFPKATLNRIRQLAWQARQIDGLHLISVDARNPELLVLNFREIPVILGRADHGASDRLARLLPLRPKIAELGDVLKSVDLRWEQQVTFHTKPNAQLEIPEPPPGA